jgi:plastocyanin domain-containing protein
MVTAVCVALSATVACNKSSAQRGEGDQLEHSEHAMHGPGPTSTEDAARSILPISVGEHGFQPSRVSLKRKHPAALRFTRVSDKTCAKEVVFPELGLRKELPLNQPVDVPIPTDAAHQLSFQCGMGMYRSAVVIN